MPLALTRPRVVEAHRPEGRVSTQLFISRARLCHALAYTCCLFLPLALLTSNTGATVLHLSALLLVLVEHHLRRGTSDRATFVRLEGLEAPIALYIGAFALSSLLGVDPAQSLGYWTELRRILIAYAVANVVRTARETTGLVIATIAPGLVFTALAWQERFVDGVFKPRVGSSTPNDFAMLMLLAACLAIGYAAYLSLRPWPRAAMALVAAIVLYGMVLPNCRSAIVGTALGVVVASILLSFRRALVLAGLFTLGLLVLPDEIKVRLQTIPDTTSTPNAYRIRTAELSLAIVRDYPVFGIGRRNFPSVAQLYEGSAEDPRPNAHNNYLNVLVEMGPLGLIALLWFHGGLILGGWRRYACCVPGSLQAATQAACLGAFMAFIVAGFTIFNWGYLMPVSLMWLLVGLAHSAGASPPHTERFAPQPLPLCP